MRIFLSAAYGRRLELCDYRDELVAMGHEVRARWLDGPEIVLPGGYQLSKMYERRIEEGDYNLAPSATTVLRELAAIDIEDIMAAECFVNFTEPPESDASRGERHVELGFLLGVSYAFNVLHSNSLEQNERTPRIIVVGYRENLFHWLPNVEFAATWNDVRGMLG